jgi:hypothetical protein
MSNQEDPRLSQLRDYMKKNPSAFPKRHGEVLASILDPGPPVAPDSRETADSQLLGSSSQVSTDKYQTEVDSVKDVAEISQTPVSSGQRHQGKKSKRSVKRGEPPRLPFPTLPPPSFLGNRPTNQSSVLPSMPPTHSGNRDHMTGQAELPTFPIFPSHPMLSPMLSPNAAANPLHSMLAFILPRYCMFNAQTTYHTSHLSQLLTTLILGWCKKEITHGLLLESLSTIFLRALEVYIGTLYYDGWTESSKASSFLAQFAKQLAELFCSETIVPVTSWASHTALMTADDLIMQYLPDLASRLSLKRLKRKKGDKTKDPKNGKEGSPAKSGT